MLVYVRHKIPTFSGWRVTVSWPLGNHDQTVDWAESSVLCGFRSNGTWSYPCNAKPHNIEHIEKYNKDKKWPLLSSNLNEQGLYSFQLSNSMTFHNFFHDLLKVSMTLGLAVTFEHFQNFPCFRVLSDLTQFNRHKLWCLPKYVSFINTPLYL